MKTYCTILDLKKKMHHNCKQKKIYSHQLDKTQNKEINRKEHVLKLHSVFWRKKMFRNEA